MKTLAPVSVGIIGGGFMAAVHTRAARAAGAQIVGIASSSAERARFAAETLGIERWFGDAEELIHDPGVAVVHVCTPNSTHAGIAEAALNWGKHVVCEKPLGVDQEEGDHLAALADASGKIAAVPFVYRYHPMVQELRERIRQGELGRMVAIRGSYLQDWLLEDTDGNWRIDSVTGGHSRAFADIGSHLVDLLEFVTGLRIIELTAAISTVHPERNGVVVKTEDVAAITVRLDNNIVGSLLVSQTAAGHDNDLQIEVMGTRAAASFSQQSPDTLTIGSRGSTVILGRGGSGLTDASAELSIVPSGHPMGYQDAFNAFIRDVYGAVRGVERARLPTFADGARMNRIAATVLTSAASGTWEPVPASLMKGT